MLLGSVMASIDREAIVDLTRRLVRIPSVNPPGDYGEISALMRTEMNAAGLETRVIEGEAGKTNVFGFLPAKSPSARTILLSGHMDVVGSGDTSHWRFDPFSARVADGAIWGRGTVDMKGALAAMLFAAKAVAGVVGPLSVGVMLGATVDDETAGAMGQKYVLEEGLRKAGWPRPDLHILGEANDLNVTAVFKGRLWTRVAVRGKTAHGGAPQQGVNAIEKVIEYIRRLRELPVRFHPLLGEDSLNLGTLHGGTRVNCVPDECEATLDFRFSGASGDEARQALEGVMQQLREEDRSFSLKEFSVFEKRDPVEVSGGSTEVELIRNAIVKITGRPAHILGALSAGDAYHSLKQGIPAVWVGPGDTRQLHAVDEHVLLDDLFLAARVYASILLAYAGIDG